jgi:predicted nucleotidyltransferase
MPSKKSQEFKDYQRKLKPLLNRYSIHDIVIFGSLTKGKSHPQDIDIAVISDRKEPKLREEIKTVLPTADIQFIRWLDIYSPIWSVLIAEGFSIRHNRYISELHKLNPMVLYKYSLKKFSPVEKVQFTRGLNSILHETGAKKLMRTVLLVPLDKMYVFQDFLKTWKIDFESRSYNLMPILRKDEI